MQTTLSNGMSMFYRHPAPTCQRKARVPRPLACPLPSAWHAKPTVRFNNSIHRCAVASPKRVGQRPPALPSITGTSSSRIETFPTLFSSGPGRKLHSLVLAPGGSTISSEYQKSTGRPAYFFGLCCRQASCLEASHRVLGGLLTAAAEPSAQLDSTTLALSASSPPTGRQIAGPHSAMRVLGHTHPLISRPI